MSPVSGATTVVHHRYDLSDRRSIDSINESIRISPDITVSIPRPPNAVRRVVDGNSIRSSKDRIDKPLSRLHATRRVPCFRLSRLVEGKVVKADLNRHRLDSLPEFRNRDRFRAIVEAAVPFLD